MEERSEERVQTRGQRVAVIDPDPVRRSQIAQRVDNAAVWQSVDAFPSARTLERLHSTWDIVLLAADLVPAEREELVHLVGLGRVVAIVVYADQPQIKAVIQALSLPIRGFLARNGMVPPRLAGALETVAGGGAVLDPESARQLLYHLHRTVQGGGTRRARASLLSSRELEILQLVAGGFRNKEVAFRLGIATGTVRTHLRTVFRKLGVATRAEAVHRLRFRRGPSDEMRAS